MLVLLRDWQPQAEMSANIHHSHSHDKDVEACINYLNMKENELHADFWINMNTV